jgi:hypothetical protein
VNVSYRRARRTRLPARAAEGTSATAGIIESRRTQPWILIVAMLWLCLTLCVPLPAGAAASPSHHGSTRNRPDAAPGQKHGHFSVKPRLNVATAARNRSVTKTEGKPKAGRSGGVLRLDGSTFSPAHVNARYDYATTAAIADGDWFRRNHTRSYTQLHMRFGYYERADGTDKGGHPFSLHWQPSVYSSVAAAVAAFKDARAHTKALTTATQNCSDVFGVPCFLATYNVNGAYTETYEIVQVHQCIGESADMELHKGAFAPAVANTASLLHIAAEALLARNCRAAAT